MADVLGVKTSHGFFSMKEERKIFEGEHTFSIEGTASYDLEDVAKCDLLEDISGCKLELSFSSATNRFHIEKIFVPKEITDLNMQLAFIADCYGEGYAKNNLADMENYVAGNTLTDVKLDGTYIYLGGSSNTIRICHKGANGFMVTPCKLYQVRKIIE